MLSLGQPQQLLLFFAVVAVLVSRRSPAFAVANLEDHSHGGGLGALLESLRNTLTEFRAYPNAAAHGISQEDNSRQPPPPRDVHDRLASDITDMYRRSARSKYPDLMDEDRVRLNIRVDLVLIGFQGSKDNPLEVPHETLVLWLEHLIGTVPHATTIADHSSASSSHSRDNRAKREDMPGLSPPAQPDVEYVYQFRVVDVHNKVQVALEAHMRSHLRNEGKDPGGNKSGSSLEKDIRVAGQTESRSSPGDKKKTRKMYMPSWHMENLLGSLVDALKISEQPSSTPSTSFTLFVLNPRRAWALPLTSSSADDGKITYGYRCGLSLSAMASLAADQKVLLRAENMEQAEQARWRIVHGAPGEDPDIDVSRSEEDEWHSSFRARQPSEDRSEERKDGRSNQAHVKRVEPTQASYDWALKHLDNLPIPDSSEANQKWDTQAWSLSQEKAFLLQGDPDSPPEGRARTILRDVLEEYRRGGARRDGGGGSGGYRSGSTCLTDTWVSGERFAWVDLQAGPFEWGPAAGGEGYKSTSSTLMTHPPPSVVPDGRPDGASSNARLGEILFREMETLRDKLSSRTRRLEALQKQMACETKVEKKIFNDPSRRDRRLDVVSAACEEVSSKLAFLHRFQVQENEFFSATEFAVSAAAEDDKSFAEALSTLQHSHVTLLREVIGELAPAIESDSTRFTEDNFLALGVDSWPLLAKLVALVSSLARGVITPASMLPLSFPPQHTHGNAAQKTTAQDRKGHAGLSIFPSEDWSSTSPQGYSSTPYQVLTGPVLTPFSGGSKTQSGLWLKGFMPKGATSKYPFLFPPPFSALDFYVPESLAFTLYVVCAQDNYPPFGTLSSFSDRGDDAKSLQREIERSENEREKSDSALGIFGNRANQKQGADKGYMGGLSGFDLPAFQVEAMSLRLPNQQASFTVHQVGASSDPMLASALAGATRESSVNIITAEGKPLVDRRVYIDSAAIHHQLKARADEGLKEQKGGAKEKGQRYPRQITIVLFSFEGPESVYVDEMWRARAVGGDTVVVAQSEPRHDTAPPLTCGGRAVDENPRNPLRQALAALASIVGGLVPSQDSWNEAPGGGVVHDWKWSMSQSPMSPLVPHALFSKVDQDIIYRTHAVRALTASKQLTSAGSSLLLSALSIESCRKALEGSLTERLTTTLRLLKAASNLRTEISGNVDNMVFDRAISQLNPLLDASRKAYAAASQLAYDASPAMIPQRAGEADYSFASAGKIEAAIFRLVLALVAAIGAAWWLVQTWPQPPGARHLKRVKVN